MEMESKMNQKKKKKDRIYGALWVEEPFVTY